MCRAVRPQKGCLVHPKAHRFGRNRQEVDLGAVVGREVPRRLRAPAQAQGREHEGSRCVRCSAPRPLEMTEPSQRAAQRSWSALRNSRRPSQDDQSVRSEGRVDVFCPRCPGAGQHRCGCVLSSAEPISGFGRVYSDGLELCRSEAQNLRAPKHPRIRASESQIASVCPGLSQLPDALRSPRCPRQPPLDDERPPLPSQL